MATTMALTDQPRKRGRKPRAVTELPAGPGGIMTTTTGAPTAMTPHTLSPAGPTLAEAQARWAYAIRNMQAVIITLALCVTAITCVWIASSRSSVSSTPRFQTIDFDDEDGKTLLKFDRESGRAWRLAKMRIPVRARKADGSAGPELVAGWEEIAPSFEKGVQDTWHRLGAPTPPPQ